MYKTNRVSVFGCTLQVHPSVLLDSITTHPSLSAVDCSMLSTTTCQGPGVVGMIDHAAAYYYNPLPLIMHVPSSLHYLRLHVNITPSILSSPQALYLKHKPATVPEHTTQQKHTCSPKTVKYFCTLIVSSLSAEHLLCRTSCTPKLLSVTRLTMMALATRASTWCSG